MDAVPVAQPDGPPLPAAVVRKLAFPAALLQKPPVPTVEANPSKMAIRELAQESFHGISGM
jgi:hypothetical protein